MTPSTLRKLLKLPLRELYLDGIEVLEEHMDEFECVSKEAERHAGLEEFVLRYDDSYYEPFLLRSDFNRILPE
jgi:hypothetical protein